MWPTRRSYACWDHCDVESALRSSWNHRSRHALIDLLLVQTEFAFPVGKCACYVDTFTRFGVAPFYQGGHLWTASVRLVALEAVGLFVIVVNGTANDARSSGQVDLFRVVVGNDGRDYGRARGVVFLFNWQRKTWRARETGWWEVVCGLCSRRGRTLGAL